MEQREIKFRIWKPEYKRMDSVRLESYYGGRGLYDLFTGCASGLWLQYIGRDAENGENIFEGDICRATFKNSRETLIVQGQVLMEDYMWCLSCVDESFSINRVFNLEIIGNIYETPELISENGILSPAKTTEL